MISFLYAIFWSDSSLLPSLNWDILNDIKGKFLNNVDVFLNPSSCCSEGKPEFSLCFVQELTHSCTGSNINCGWTTWLSELIGGPSARVTGTKAASLFCAADTRVHQLVMPEAPLEVWRRHEGHVKVSSQIESRKYDGSGGIDSDVEDVHVRRWQQPQSEFIPLVRMEIRG